MGMYCGRGDGSDFSVELDQGRGNTVFTANFGNNLNCKAEYVRATDLLTVQVVNCPVVRGDTRVLFQSSSTQVPKNYEKCPFYFWFHTAFVRDGKLVLNRESQSLRFQRRARWMWMDVMWMPVVTAPCARRAKRGGQSLLKLSSLESSAVTIRSRRDAGGGCAMSTSSQAGRAELT